jgi:hypothetical protein
MPSVSFEDFMSGGSPATPVSDVSTRDPLPQAIRASATSLGIDPVDLATTIGYETAGTYDPWKKGPTTKWGTHRGLIQWGEPQAAQYGVAEDTPVEQQMQAVTQYLRDRGVQPGMGTEDIYSAINAGSVGRPNASDRPGFTVRRHAQEMEAFRPQAAAMLASAAPVSLSFEEFMGSPAAAGVAAPDAAPVEAQAAVQLPISDKAAPPTRHRQNPPHRLSESAERGRPGHDANPLCSKSESDLR